MEETEQVMGYIPKLLLTEAGEGLFSTAFQHCDGTLEQRPAISPAKDLIAAAEIDYRPYRREVKRLRDEHPLFAPRLEIPMADVEDFAAEALLLPSMLQKIDPVGFFALGILLDQVLQREDDGSALFLLDAAQEVLQMLEEPVRTQVYLRNILEMTFDGMERATQRERFEKLCRVYPDVGKLCNPASLSDMEPGHRTFRAHSIFGLRMLELALYFQQDKQRIARCDYCWGWFIPKTKKATRYCDRVTDGFPCKKRGARFKRNLVEDEDGALKICNQLRDRMYARLLRWQDAAPGERANLIPMEYDQYDAWSENARLARMEYLKGKLTAEEFLRRIDTTHELDSYEADKAEQIGQTVWQQRVAGDISFDPKLRYPETIQCLDFDLGTVELKWEIYTADDLRRQEQRGHQSLRERYQKEY